MKHCMIISYKSYLKDCKNFTIHRSFRIFTPQFPTIFFIGHDLNDNYIDFDCVINCEWILHMGRQILFMIEVKQWKNPIDFTQCTWHQGLWQSNFHYRYYYYFCFISFIWCFLIMTIIIVNQTCFIFSNDF